jgi:hypothetical protein
LCHFFQRFHAISPLLLLTAEDAENAEFLQVRITHHASRITHHASRITHHASRITHYALYFYATEIGFNDTAVFWFVKRVFLVSFNYFAFVQMRSPVY